MPAADRVQPSPCGSVSRALPCADQTCFWASIGDALGVCYRIGQGRVASRFWAAPRREEGEYPLRSLTDEQQRCSPKAPSPFGPGFFCLLASSLARHVATAMLLTRLLARRQKPSRRSLALFDNTP
jgi:hypothetical protein